MISKQQKTANMTLEQWKELAKALPKRLEETLSFMTKNKRYRHEFDLCTDEMLMIVDAFRTADRLAKENKGLKEKVQTIQIEKETLYHLERLGLKEYKRIRSIHSRLFEPVDPKLGDLEKALAQTRLLINGFMVNETDGTCRLCGKPINQIGSQLGDVGMARHFHRSVHMHQLLCKFDQLLSKLDHKERDALQKLITRKR
jgi:hypothetical protein